MADKAGIQFRRCSDRLERPGCFGAPARRLTGALPARSSRLSSRTIQNLTIIEAMARGPDSWKQVNWRVL